ncbi:MAG: hypothetical protein M5U08_19880 [Burkholderiales bacterium]|nr:hypothetical protein [Burkholderiales bacterium]
MLEEHGDVDVARSARGPARRAAKEIGADHTLGMGVELLAQALGQGHRGHDF